jgi:hypothetical protein
MPILRKRRRRSFSGARAIALSAIALALGLGPGPGTAQAAGPPIILGTWASSVFSSSARLEGQANPNGLFSTYHFDYITQAAYDANLTAAKDPFTGAARSPLGADASIGSGTSPVSVLQQPSGLAPATAYRYRIVAKNTTTTTGPAKAFITQAVPAGTDGCPNATAREQSGAKNSEVADCRGWEMVSPVDKNGGQAALPGAIAGGGVLQAASQGGSVTYGSEASFAGGQGAPPASQYLATRVPGGWATENLTAPVFSGTYDSVDQGVPYQLFSGDLARAILLNGDHCRGEGSGCAVANPPLAGTDAPAGYQNYYLREGAGFTALLGASSAGFLSLEPKAFDLRLAGSSPDLRHGVLSTCAALSANATEVALGEGCDPAAQNLYQYSPGTGLSLLNLLPGETTGTTGAALAAQSGAVSEDGSRIYFTQGGNLYLRAAGQTKQAGEDAGGGGSFETTSADGTVAFFTKGEHLWRYLAASDGATDLTPGGGVKGVLGASADGTYAYYQDAAALKLWHAGTTATVAPGAQAAEESDWPPSTGTARVSPDGTKLLFTSKEPLTEYDNTDLKAKVPDSEVFLYGASGPGTLSCLSCNPTLGRPIGPSSIPGSVANGTAEGSTDSYKPRVLSASGRRVFFDSSDALALADTNGSPDAYQWEAQGEGSCAKPGGCISLLSSGRDAGGARFTDASADGADAFFITAGSLAKADPGVLDIYDARIGGGFPEPPPPVACEGDACQPLPSPPADPTLTTLLTGPGNPPVRFPKAKCPKGKALHKGKCVKKGAKKGKGSTKKGKGKGKGGKG